jgi:hypothetical protein
LDPGGYFRRLAAAQVQIDLTKHLKVQTTLGTGGTPATGITPETIPAAASVSLMGSNTSRLRMPALGHLRSIPEVSLNGKVAPKAAINSAAVRGGD